VFGLKRSLSCFSDWIFESGVEGGSPSLAAALHLGMGLGRRIYLRQMKQTIQTLGRPPQEPVPPAVREELLRRFRVKT